MKKCKNCKKDINGGKGSGNKLFCSSTCNIKFNSIENKNGKIINGEHCIEFNGHKNKNGYGTVSLQKHEHTTNKSRNILVHRKIFQFHNPTVDIMDMNINHHCDNPSCVNPNHLYCGTQLENIEDMLKRKRGFIPKSPCGESHHKSKLSDKEVWTIRFKEDGSQRFLAKKYGVNKSTIRDIKNNKSRKYVIFDMFN